MEGRSLKRAGIALVFGVGQYVFFLALAEIYYPGYSVSSNAISDLGASCSKGVCLFVQPSSEIFDTSVVLLGIALLVTGHYLWKVDGAKLVAAFGALAGLGAIGVGIFNESYGSVHSLVSAITFISGGIQALFQYNVAKPPFGYFAALTGVVTLAATALYASHTYLGLGQGGMERMVVYPIIISGLAFGGYLMSLGDTKAV